MASMEFNTSWELIIKIMGELKRQFAPDHFIKRAIEAEIHNFPMVSEDVFSLNKFTNLYKKVNLHKSTCRDLAKFDMAEGTSSLRSKLHKNIQEYYGTEWAQYETRFKVSPTLFFIFVIKQYRDKTISSRYAPILTHKDRNVKATEIFSRDLSKVVNFRRSQS